MVECSIGRPPLPGEKRQSLNLGPGYGTKSLRHEKKLAHSSTETQSGWEPQPKIAMDLVVPLVDLGRCTWFHTPQANLQRAGKRAG